MSNTLVLDIEAKERVDFDNPHEAGMSVCCTWDSWGNGGYGRYRFFQDHQEDVERLCDMLEWADNVVTFNGNRYDLKVIKHLADVLPPFISVDLMPLIVDALGHRLSLENVARATLGRGKSGHGLGALEYYRLGYYGALCSYCMDDVTLTRDVYLFAKRWGFIHATHRDTGALYQVPMDIPGGIEHRKPVRGKR